MTEDRILQRKKSKSEVSAGGIVYKKQDGRVFVLLIMPNKRDPNDETFTPVWTFPKGWIGDHGSETLEQTAVREVREEGGVNASIISKLGEVHYFFTFAGASIPKTVHVYLMQYINGDVMNHDNEVAEAKWFELDEAAGKLTYNGDKEMLARAKAQLI